jgi:hypothetical protein
MCFRIQECQTYPDCTVHDTYYHIFVSGRITPLMKYIAKHLEESKYPLELRGPFSYRDDIPGLSKHLFVAFKMVNLLQAGLAIKNPTKKPNQNNPKKIHLKKPTKNGFFGFFFNFKFFMKILQTFLFETDF